MWSSLQSIRSQSAVAHVWRRHLGSNFNAFKGAFLQRRPEPVKLYPAPTGCPFPHEIAPRPDSSLFAVCRADPGAPASLPARCSDTCVNAPPPPLTGNRGYLSGLRGDSIACPGFAVTPEDIACWELSW